MRSFWICLLNCRIVQATSLRIFPLLIALSLVFTASGCSVRSGFLLPSSLENQSFGLDPNTAQTLCPVASCRVVGRVHAHAWAPAWLPFLLRSDELLYSDLVDEAFSLGANAVMGVQRYSRSQFEWREEHLVGTAVLRGSEGALSE
jgi:hypothetical protein